MSFELAIIAVEAVIILVLLLVGIVNFDRADERDRYWREEFTKQAERFRVREDQLLDRAQSRTFNEYASRWPAQPDVGPPEEDMEPGRRVIDEDGYFEAFVQE